MKKPNWTALITYECFACSYIASGEEGRKRLHELHCSKNGMMIAFHFCRDCVRNAILKRHRVAMTERLEQYGITQEEESEESQAADLH